MSPVGNWSKHAATGLLLILALWSSASFATPTVTITDVSQSSASAPSGYTISFSGDSTSNFNMSSARLQVDGGVGSCINSDGGANGNWRPRTRSGSFSNTDFGAPALAAGSYTINLYVYGEVNCDGDTANDSESLTVTGANSAPVAVNDTASTDEDTALTSSADLDANDTDADGDSLSVTAGTFTTSQSGSLVLAADGSYTYTPAANFSGTDTVDYTVTDGTATDTGTLTIRVNAVNDAPVAVADAGAVNEDATLDVAASGVLGNDTDVDSNDTLAVSAIRTGSETGSGTSGSLGSALTGAYGDVTMNADGSYAYIANNAAALAAGAQVTDTFTYTVTDGNITDTAEIVITITGTNDPPFATDDASAVDEDDTLSIAATGLLANDTDADAGASLSITAIRTGAESGSGTAGSIGVALAGAYGDFTVNADGSYSYNANNANALAAGTTATDTFTYTVSDGTITDTAEIVITVTGVNDPPVLTGDLAAPIDEGAPTT